MVSIWLTPVKDRVGSLEYKKNRLRNAKPIRLECDDWSLPIGGIAGYGWCAGRPSHADQSRIATRGIRRRSAYIGCTPLLRRAGRRERRQQLRPCGESPTVWSRARAGQLW